MLYLDSSVIVKRYVREAGSDLVRARCMREELLFSSALSYAEVLAALSRKRRDRDLSRSEFEKATHDFLRDWLYFQKLELDVKTLGAVRDLVERFAIRGADSVHLSAAIWLRNATLWREGLASDSLEFAVADAALARIAAELGLTVFNPEMTAP